ncbi:MAG: pirin family protein [Gammaproteobacteria bacterium]|nr:pirin family protein [Gammaproteobacteria bacterium]
MSDSKATESASASTDDSIELVLEPAEKDLGGFSVRRVLPAHERQMVGPFIFFDHMGPAEFPPGEGIQVRPHPHVCLSTVTYLFEGEIMHRDSLGYEQPIRAEAVNLMTAGRGIVHSERAGEDLHTTSRLHGIQSWMALPDHEEEREASFEHYPAGSLPDFEHDGVAIRLIMGEAWGHVSPVTRYLPTLYIECRLPAGSVFSLPDQYDEIGAYVVAGALEVDDRALGAHQMAVARAGKTLRLAAQEDSHVMVVGGSNPGERHIWWNFVASSRERIEQASADWRENRFDKVPGETEFIPLPE